MHLNLGHTQTVRHSLAGALTETGCAVYSHCVSTTGTYSVVHHLPVRAGSVVLQRCASQAAAAAMRPRLPLHSRRDEPRGQVA